MSKLKKQWYENVVTVFKAHLCPWASPFHPPLGIHTIPDSYAGAQLLQQVPILCQTLSAHPPLPVPPALWVVVLDYAAGSVQSSCLQVLSCCCIIWAKRIFCRWRDQVSPGSATPVYCKHLLLCSPLLWWGLLCGWHPRPGNLPPLSGLPLTHQQKKRQDLDANNKHT